MSATFIEIPLKTIAGSAYVPPEISDVQMPPTVKLEILQPDS